MSGLAEILLNLGYSVSGSDLHASDITDRLAGLGLRFAEGHAAENLGNAGIVVVSAAVPQDNPELSAARALGVPILERTDLLAHLMRLKPNAVAVGGAHGKTTVTSMISAMLDEADIGATSIVGGILHRSGTNAQWGTGDYLVAEACEHNGAFLHLHPTISVVTCIDAEHLDYYGTLDNIKRAFTQFCNVVPFYGYAILCSDDEHCRAILPDIASVTVTYGLQDGAGLRADNIRLTAADGARPMAEQIAAIHTTFDVISADERLDRTGCLGTVRVNAIGEHNVRNALAACAVGLCLGMPFEQIAAGIAAYDGVRRRLQPRGTANGITVLEDYAHHPTELAATLAAVRLLEPRRIVAVFQPHLYTRTQYFHKEFAEVLARADVAYVTDIYPAREEPLPGVDACLVVNAARESGAAHVNYLRDMHEAAAHLPPRLQPGDAVLVLGAGNINAICAPLLAALEERAWSGA